VGYSELEYQELSPAEYVRTPSREDLMHRAMELCEQGQVGFNPSERACAHFFSAGLDTDSD
jgi:hypothetical protein